MPTPANGGGGQAPPPQQQPQQGNGGQAAATAGRQEIAPESLGGLLSKNSGGLMQGAFFGIIWIWGPALSWWQWVLVCMAGFIVMLYFRQSSMLYARTPANMPKTPADNPPTYKSPAEHAIKHEEVYIDTSDGCRIHAWWMPHATRSAGVPTVIFFHGNAGNIGYRLPLLKELYHKGSMNILAVDYRGYGFSTGEPSEAGLKIDAEAALDYVLSRPDAQPSRVVVFGKSLGGAVAVALAAARPHHVHGVMLENTYTSMAALAQDLFPLVKVVRCALPYLLHNKWDTEGIIDQLRVPVQFVSGKDDKIIKPAHMKALCRAAMRNNKRVSFASLPGGHNDVPLVSGPVYQETINGFLRQFQAGHEAADTRDNDEEVDDLGVAAVGDTAGGDEDEVSTAGGDNN